MEPLEFDEGGAVVREQVDLADGLERGGELCQGFEVGRIIERALSLQIHDIVPSRISASPSVAVALTSGSRPARGGPKITP